MGETADHVAALRSFNRFYTRRIRVMDEVHLGSPYVLAEVRVLYELAQAGSLTPKAIASRLDLDAGYLSRILKRFEGEGLATREAAGGDGRSVRITLTESGRAAYAPLHERANAQMEGVIAHLSPARRDRLVAAAREIETLLGREAEPQLVRLRRHRVGDMGWVTERHGVLYGREYGWDERFEAMVARICADFIEHLDPDRERCWIAERDGERVGSIFLVKGEGDAAKLRLLLLEPSARGLGLGKRLVDECVGFARACGYGAVTLWTQSILTAARAVYVGAGFELVESWPNRDFGGLGLTSERWVLRL